jgi:hypothetical protein
VVCQLIWNLSIYHDSALPCSRAQNALAEPKRFRRHFHVFVDVDVLDRALAFITSGLASCSFVFDVLR